jgi:hypothetical protein
MKMAHTFLQWRPSAQGHVHANRRPSDHQQGAKKRDQRLASRLESTRFE